MTTAAPTTPTQPPPSIVVSTIPAPDGGTAELVGVSHSSIDWGDYDRDGDLDLAVSGRDRFVKQRLIVYRNDGGIFRKMAEPMGSNQGVSGGSIQWGDMDNDGDLDLAVSGRNDSNGLIVFRNDGGGIFIKAAAPMDGNTGLYSSSIDWGDYDGDGDLDLAVSGTIDRVYGGTTNRLIIYRNDGGGQFTKAAEPMGPGAGLHAASIDWGDYDNDGDPDLAVSGGTDTIGGRTLAIYRNEGGGRFTKAAEPMGPNRGVAAGAIQWADYDRDGDLDLAVSGYDASRQRLILFRNDGGVLTQAAEPMGLNNGVVWSSIDWGDADRDGDLDLAVSGFFNRGMRCLFIFRNDGGNFVNAAEPMGAGVGVHMSSIQWGDLDGDGDLDLAVSGDTSNPMGSPTLILFRNDIPPPVVQMPTSSSSGLQPVTEGTSSSSTSSTSGTASGGGGATAGGGSGGESGGGGTSSTSTTSITAEGFVVPDATTTFVFTEIPPVTSEDGTVSNEGTSEGEAVIISSDSIMPLVQPATPTETATAEETTQAENDNPVMISTPPAPTTTRVTTSTTSSDGTSSSSTTSTTTADPAYPSGGVTGLFDPDVEPMGPGAGVRYSSIRWGDYDRDGDLDLAASGWDGTYRADGQWKGRLIVYRNDGGGRFTKTAEPMGVDSGLWVSSIDWGDYDRDGDLDLVVSGLMWFTDGRKLMIYRNDGGTWTKALDLMGSGGGVGSSSIQWGDVDHDGDPDLAVSGVDRVGVPKLILYKNKGDGTFSAAEALMGTDSGVWWSSLDWGDYDHDGDLDLAVSGAEKVAKTTDPRVVQPRLIVFRNDGGVLVKAAEPMGISKGVFASSIDWGDYDRDGDLDLAVCGVTGDVKTRLIVYRNDGDGRFTAVSEPLGLGRGVHTPSIQWGDFDNDGDLDLAVSGYDGSNSRLILFRNDGGILTKVAEPMGVGFGVSGSSIQWGDYDNDGDLDLAVSGADNVGKARLILFRNNLGAYLATTNADTENNSQTDSEPQQASTSSTASTAGSSVVSETGIIPVAAEYTESSMITAPIDTGAAVRSDTPVAAGAPETHSATLPPDTTAPDTAATVSNDTTLSGSTVTPPPDTATAAGLGTPPADTTPHTPPPVEWLPPPNGLTAICHRPPGNPDKAHAIFVSKRAVKAHLAHGDQLGPCAGSAAGPDRRTGVVGVDKTRLKEPLTSALENRKRVGLSVEIKNNGNRPQLATLTKKLPPGIRNIRQAKFPGGHVEIIERPDGFYLEARDIPIEPAETAVLEIEFEIGSEKAEAENAVLETLGESNWEVQDRPDDVLSDPIRAVKGRIADADSATTVTIFNLTGGTPEKMAELATDSRGRFELSPIPDTVLEMVVRIERPGALPEFRRIKLGEEKSIVVLDAPSPERIPAGEGVSLKMENPEERQEAAAGEGEKRSRIDIPPKAVDRNFYLTMREPKNLAEIEAAAKARGERLLSATEIILIDEETGEEIHNGFKKRIRIAFSLANLKAREGAKVSHYDPANKKLDDVSSAVDLEKGEVTADVEHFSIYASLGVPAAASAPTYTDFSQLLVYPNPYEARYGTNRVFFENLPASAELTIYTIGGQIVHEITNDGAADLNGSTRGTTAAAHIGWGLTNRNGRNVASTIYLFVLQDAAGNVKNGRVAVVR